MDAFLDGVCGTCCAAVTRRRRQQLICFRDDVSEPAGVHRGGYDASPPGSERRRHQEPVPEGQEEEKPVASVSSPRPPGQRHRPALYFSVLPNMWLLSHGITRHVC